MTGLLAQLQFVRPHWLWALAALPLLAAWWYRQQRRASIWHQHVDAHLLPHVLETGATRAGSGGLAVRMLAFALAVVALAGPGWRHADVEVRQDGRALVVALDLSSAMLAPDLPPSRLLQARAWLASLLESHEGEVGLVVFADDAFTVVPLTGDPANVAIFLDALAPDLMPVDGHRPDRAIHHALALLARAGHARGDILLLSNAADAATVSAAQRARAQGVRVSVLGLGRPAGASYRAGDGSLRPSRLEAASLQQVAQAGGGAYASLAAVGTAGVGSLLPGASFTDGGDTRTLTGTRLLLDGGYWLLPPLMLLVLFAFRRGVALMALGALMLLPPGLQAAGPGPDAGTPWRRADQVAHARMREGLEAYRAGRHDEAERIWRDLPGADAAYNRGNALARAGRLEDALKAYDEALRRQPGMQDAIANRALVEAALRRDPPQGQGGPRQQPDAGNERDGDGQPGGSAPDPAQDAASGSDGEPRGEAEDPPEPEGPQDAPEPPRQDGDGDQQQADAAQRERMQRALEEAGQGAEDDDGRAVREDAQEAGGAERERREAVEAWLRRVPDDPGGLLRARFRLEHERRSGGGGAR
ncbi:VWA domain-containing protein [Luteimonas sp. J29]|uniref:VWA domain-containing protein n=1 Tax=Luteimonas sp. J29 TaxID=935863 RepID=UPI000478EFE7|nr:VWA domain-containing protein [Luteimonas sp. J29]